MTSCPDRIITGHHYQTGQYVFIRIQAGKIAEINFDRDHQLQDDQIFVGPGLVDLQVNGFKGWDFNAYPMRIQTAAEVTKALWEQGVTSYFPTIISNSDEVTIQLLKVLSQACQADTTVAHAVRGIHLEGPFVSPIDGPRGAHDRRFVKAPDWSLFQRFQDAANGMIQLITVSPEWSNAAAFIARCVEIGVHVAIGHTAASTEQIAEAVAAGASLSTHLGNGAHAVLPRHPNYIWDQLANDQLFASVVVDGFHLPDSVLRVIKKVKQNKMLLISDAVYLSGMEPGIYHTHIGGDVTLTADRRLSLTWHPELLAGSVSPLIYGINYLVNRDLVTLSEAWDMASVRPAAYMQMENANGLMSGAPADLVVLRRRESGTQVLQVFQRGHLVYGDEAKETRQ